jgi:beta-galactosidase/beta-glucuronidase
MVNQQHAQRTCVLFILITLSIATAPAQAHAIAIPSEPEHAISLDGVWRFKIEQPGDRPEKVSIGGAPKPIKLPECFEPFEKLDYKEDETWHDISVPSNWEMSGHSLATFNQPDNAIGIYRLWFDVPAHWRDRLVKVNFDGVQNGAEIFLNGQPVNVTEPARGRANYHECGMDAFQADLTPQIRFGQKNLLAVRVYKNTPSVDLDSGDFFFLGGIHRSATLFSVPQVHLDDVTVRTRLLEHNKAELRVIVAVESSPAGAKVAMQIVGQPAVEAEPDRDGRAELVQILDHPRLWSAEHPNLYNLAIHLSKDGQVTEQFTKRIGIREVSIQAGVLLVNNVPVKLTGMCRHDIHAEVGTAFTPELYRQELTLMKAANVNAVRTSHYPYGPAFYDLCDELGLYVADEMSAGWCSTTDEKLAPAFAQRARELVQRDKNHPSVLIWAIGNENKPGPSNKVAADEIKKLDPTRPRLVSWRRAEHAGVELDDLHYTNPPEIAKANADLPRRNTIPITYLENPNIWEARNGADFGCVDRWVHVIDRTWQEVWKDDHVPGSFLWEWQDRAVCDKNDVHLYDYDPATGVNLVKVKGLNDGFRNPRPDYYHVKMAYAPIRLETTTEASDSSVTLHATNRFSFTDLAEVDTVWHLLSDGKEIAKSTAHLNLPPRSHADLKLDLPADALARADSLRIEFNHPDGRNLVTYQLRLKPERDTTPKLNFSDLAGINFPHLNFSTVTFGSNRIGWRWAYRHFATLANIKVQRADGKTDVLADESSLYKIPLAGIRAMDADMFIAGDPALVPGRAGAATQRDRQSKTTQPTEAELKLPRLVAHLHTQLDNGRFSYRIDWIAPDGDVQELGWAFTMPGKTFDHFSWHRQAYWSWYPDTHIGRPAGTALPDSMNVPISKMTRPDAFDFNSTKYDCDWATLTTASGKGLAVTCSPDARQHCRAGIDDDGNYRLIVNRQCSPPRDLSSGVVPDLYFVMKKNIPVECAFTLGKL